jgi:hypothetical protein
MYGQDLPLHRFLILIASGDIDPGERSSAQRIFEANNPVLRRTIFLCEPYGASK